jgi:hypothetical protein
MEDRITTKDINSSFKNMRYIMTLVNANLNAESKFYNPNVHLNTIEELAYELVAEANILAQYVIDEKLELLRKEAKALTSFSD